MNGLRLNGGDESHFENIEEESLPLTSLKVNGNKYSENDEFAAGTGKLLSVCFTSNYILLCTINWYNNIIIKYK